MQYMYAILITFLFVSCMPEPAPVNSSATDRTGSTTEDSSNDSVVESDSTSFENDISWLDNGLSSPNLTLSTKDKKNIFLVGDEVHNFLEINSNFSATYCVEIRFSQTDSITPKRLRAKVIPALSNLLSNGTSMKYMRVNLNENNGNDFCNLSSLESVAGMSVLVQAGDSNYINSSSINYLSIVDGNDVPLVYKAEDVCPNCLNSLNSEEIIFYKYAPSSNRLERVTTNNINYPGLSLRINLNTTSNDTSGSCSQNTCQSSGFDCCVEGQCVNEKSVRLTGVQANPSAFIAAEREKFSNPAWYKRYPQFYNICTEFPGTEPGDDDTDNSDPDAEAQTRLEELTLDHECLEELREKSLSVPFHTAPINSNETYSSCRTSNADELEDLYYKNVLRRIYGNCGCAEKDDLDLMVLNCPAYTYKPVFEKDADGNDTDTVTSYVCITPPEDKTPLPFQNLEVIVSSKTAPHRFFNELGEELNLEEPMAAGTNTTPEGVKFEYLDEALIFPRTGSFNMNAILGQMTIELDQAKPAKVIDIEFDKRYIISTRSGLYVACPGCAKDPWFSGFSAHPSAQLGVGLQSVGFSTSRDTFDSNTTLGSYADTSFGRACWVPPTMLPFAHSENGNTKTQRLNRLMTQAAMYSNGYQRDWYGFNKGALIGSFDGVTWFAVGKGRIVTATSDKLYLAINAPFADLASPTDHVIAVQEYDFIASAPTLDYNPELETNSPSQNEAATCQENHECETDAHCITKLGWEYACADVTVMQTKWPQFEPLGSQENSNTSRTGTIAQFLQQATLAPGAGTKRCVYRGAGAPCRVDAKNITDEALRENLTCAPNFYCAQVSAAGVFNDQVARFARPLRELVESKNHLFGLDANILGRPKQYISIGNLKNLPGQVQTNLKANIQLSDSSAVNVGLCRPGKKLPSYSSNTETNDWDQGLQHQAADNLFRTDYISQIAGCNSALYTDLRYSSCPMLDNEGNYINTQESFLNDSFLDTETDTTLTKIEATEIFSFAQNSCGLEALHPDATVTTSTTSEFLSNFSAFRSIEGRSLAMSNTIVERTLARDACLRKAGAVCHTDLDCSPNKMMAANVDLVSLSYFGNEAEKSYYSEPLVCGQAQPKPRIGADNFNSFNIENNRCCRPVGSELTMFTEDSPATGSEASVGLRSDIFGSLDPTNDKRYSRYSVVDASIDRDNKESNLIRPTANTDDVDADKILDNIVNITNTNQWETIHNAAARTCCGGSWVRKFADGSNDWSRKRLNLDVSNFSCLNYRSPLASAEDGTPYGLNTNELGRDRSDFCTDPTGNRGGCIENEFGAINDFSIVRPTLNLVNFEMIIDSDQDVMAGLWATNLWSFRKLISSDEGATNASASNLVMDWTVADQADAQRLNITTTLPSYIPFDAISRILLENPDGASFGTCTRLIPAGNDYSCSGQFGVCGPRDQFPPASCGSACCYTYNDNTRKLVIAHPKSTSDNALNYGDDGNILSARIAFKAPGTLEWEAFQNPGDALLADDEAILEHRRSSTPGNALYYLKRLARLEYLGIPQMTYEPVYCNDNYQKLVPGIYHESIFGQALKTVSDYLAHDRTFIDPNATPPWNADSAPAPYNANGLNQNLVSSSELINHGAIFSDNKFQCCLELGSKTDNGSQCCSGVAVDEDGNTTAPSGQLNLTCKLPDETNLNVYFNKFVSGEGLREIDNVSNLEITDFNIKTGEPLTSATVISKLNSLGQAFCASGRVRRGGAFGNFQAKPFGPLREPVSSSTGDNQFTIVDEVSDFGNINNRVTGFQVFNFGYKWNHHVYCDGLETN